MSWRLPNMRGRLYANPDFGVRVLGFQGNGTRDANGITDSIRFGGADLGEFHFADGWISVRHLSDANGRIKRAGALSSKTLLHGDIDDWTAPFTGLAYEWNPANVHPDALDQCILEPLRHTYVQNWLPETPWEDGNFEAADLDSWVGVNCTLQKLTDQIYGLVGSWSLVATNTAANGYVAHATGFEVQPGERFQLNALARCVQGGPLSWRLYDFTGGIWGAEIETAAVAYGTTPAHLYHYITAPSGCYKINCRMQAADNGAIYAWDALPGRNLALPRFELQAYNDAGFTITGLSEARYRGVLGGASVNSDDARGKTYQAWKRPDDYDTEHLAGNSSPNAIELNRNLANISGAELWYGSQRTWWDVQPIDELTASDSPEELIYQMACANVCDLLNADGSDPFWLTKKVQYLASISALTAAQMPPRKPPRRQHVGGRVGP